MTPRPPSFKALALDTGLYAMAALLMAPACSSPKAQGTEVATITAQAPVDNDDKDAMAESLGLELKRFDLNRDEQPDIFKFYKMAPDAKDKTTQIGHLVRKEVDINHDGRVDVVILYDDSEVRTEEHTDLDFDGRIDEKAFYENNALVRKEIDLNYDGKSDISKYYVNGKLQRIESDRNSDKIIDTWEYYEGGNLDRIGTDTTGDGEVDRWEVKRVAKKEEKPAETDTEKSSDEDEDGDGDGDGSGSGSESGDDKSESPQGADEDASAQ